MSFWRLGVSARVSARRASFTSGPAAPRRVTRHAGEILSFCVSEVSARPAFCLLAAVFLHVNCGAERLAAALAAAAATVHITCGRCRLRSRSSPPLPKTTVLGAETGALGARKALTPAAHASATISRAMIAAEGSTRCYNDDGTSLGCDDERRPPPPCPTRQTPSCGQDRVLRAMNELSPAQRELAGV